MKKLIIISMLLFIGIQLSAQEQDSTQINIGKSKITIYNNENNELDELIQSQKDFTEKMRALKDSIGEFKIELKNLKEESLKEQIQKNIDEFEKQIEAYQSGIEDLENEIQKLQENQNDDEFNLDELDDMKDEFDEDGNKNKHKFEIEFPKRRKFKGHWAGFEFGMNNYTDENHKTQLPADGEFMELNTNKSWEFALNFMEFNIPLFSRYIGLVTGLGIEWNGYEFKQDIKLTTNADGVIIGETNDDITYKKNKLNITYFKIPLILELQIPVNRRDRRIFIGGGVTLSVKARAKLKQIYDVDGHEEKYKIIDDFQLNPLNYGLTARVGYRGIRLFANYSLTSLFEQAQGPELYPYSVGISLINF